MAILWKNEEELLNGWLAYGWSRMPDFIEEKNVFEFRECLGLNRNIIPPYMPLDAVSKIRDLTVSQMGHVAGVPDALNKTHVYIVGEQLQLGTEDEKPDEYTASFSSQHRFLDCVKDLPNYTLYSLEKSFVNGNFKADEKYNHIRNTDVVGISRGKALTLTTEDFAVKFRGGYLDINSFLTRTLQDYLIDKISKIPRDMMIEIHQDCVDLENKYPALDLEVVKVCSRNRFSELTPNSIWAHRYKKKYR